MFGHFTLDPGVPVEQVAYERTNCLDDATGRTELTQVIPNDGLTNEVRSGMLPGAPRRLQVVLRQEF